MRLGKRAKKDVPPGLPEWVWINLPEKWRIAVQQKRAMIAKDPKLGWCICVFNPEFRCYKIFKKFEAVGLKALSVLLDKCVTVNELAHELAIQYQYAKRYLYYYYYSGLLFRQGPYFCINDEHPQFNYIKNVLTTSPFFKGTNRDRLGQIGTEQIISRYHKQNNEITLESVLKRVREVFSDLSPCEEGVVIALYMWWRKTGKLYDDTCDEVRLFEDLCTVYPELENLCRDSLEFGSSCFGRLLRAGIVHRWRRGSLCKVRLGKRVLPVGRGGS